MDAMPSLRSHMASVWGRAWVRCTQEFGLGPFPWKSKKTAPPIRYPPTPPHLQVGSPCTMQRKIVFILSESPQEGLPSRLWRAKESALTWYRASWFSPPHYGPGQEKTQGINEKPPPPANVYGLDSFRICLSCAPTLCLLTLAGAKSWFAQGPLSL